MKVIKTVRHKISSLSDILMNTLRIYRDALGLIINVVNEEWEEILKLNTSKERFNFVEKLIHATKDNPSLKYEDFDIMFYKFPAYFRRGAKAEAIGIVSSYRSNLQNHENKKFYLHVPYEKNVPLKDRKLKEMTIVAVDLGLTHSAVCSLMKSDGTVTDRLFINQ
ncbi:MAG: hypothetical protein JW702_05935 [Clostridiales bacterium]|nr:hypothetical protein [Clostridiales bacterium]